MNLQHVRIIELCQQLKIERMAVDWAGLAQQAATQEQSFADFLEQLLRAEAEA
ncbi:ATP-binding protein [Pseudomonas kribbensis]|uniref:ATP-binding protein n=1 Tax=Pseudomonas kribbensis TaxID=1628086 RepID=UPI0013B4670A